MNLQTITRCVFDVGANDGASCESYARAGTPVIGFEPSPKYAQILRERMANWAYHVVEMAVSDYCGTSQFNLGYEWDGGVSSLLEYSDHIASTWPGRNDLKVTDTTTVGVTTLEKWIDGNMPSLREIEYLHIDAQGSDLAVLRGLGKYVGMVLAGQIEVPHSPDVQLYKGQHTMQEALDWLKQNHFEVIGRHDQQNECNLMFRSIS